MTKLLRHEAVKVQVPIDSQEGWVRMEDLLQYINYGPSVDDGGVYAAVAGPAEHRKLYTADDVREVIRLNDKQRFQLRDSATNGTPVTYVRATQGHTLAVTAVGRVLTLSQNEAEGAMDKVAAVQFAVHGTYTTALEGADGILAKGLSCMGRRHIHLAKGLLGEKGVISGMRRDCSAYIWIDVHRAIKEVG